jgi:hypothetical protein
VSDPFDPYHRWLGIAPDEQPPHHYRLLGLKLFESDPDVIDSAAVRQMSHVRSFQSGPHAVHSQRLLNQLSAAQLVLLSAEKKRAYDAQLRAELAGHEQRNRQERPVAVGAASPPAAAPISIVGSPPKPATRPSAGRASRRTLPVAMVGGVIAAVLMLVAIAGAVLLTARPWQTDSPSPTVVHGDRPRENNPPQVNTPTVPPRGGAAESTNEGANRVPSGAQPPIVPPAGGGASAENAPNAPKSTDPPIAAAPLAGLVAWWPFDEGAGDTARDAVGDHHGSIVGATWCQGKRGAALHFDGKSAIVRIDGAHPLQFAGPITMAAWIRPEHKSKGITFMNVLTQLSPAQPREIYLRICNSRYAVGCFTGNHYPTEHLVPDEDVNAWVHLAAAYDGESWRIYRNGQPFFSRKMPHGPVEIDGPWAIGGSPHGKGRHFQGDIDDVRIYGRALNEAEIASLGAAQ